MYCEEEILVTLEGRQFRLLQIANTDEVMDAVLALPDDDIHKTDERIPYWTEIWPSALALSRYIIAQKDFVAGKKILEVGAGLGLPSLVVSAYTDSVVCSDYFSDALVFSERNARLNGAEHIEHQLVDWRNYKGEKFDIILASDIAYEKRFFADLPSALICMMHGDSEVWMSEPGRLFTAPFIESLGDIFDIKSNPLPQEWRGTTFNTSIHVLKQKKQS